MGFCITYQIIIKTAHKKQFYFNHASHLKDFDVAITLETERLKKALLKEKERNKKIKKNRCLNEALLNVPNILYLYQ